MEKCIYPNLRQPRKNKTSTKKNYFTINFIHLIHKTCQILSIFTNQCHCLHHLLLTFPSSSLSFHNISWVSSIALDMQHLKPFKITFGDMHCHAVMIHIDCIINLYFLVYKLTWTHEELQFSPQMVLVVLRILNTCVLEFWWSDQSEFMALIMVFNLWIGPGFILESCS
jgi:hypothetical protein